MFTLGAILFIVSGLIVYGSDMLVKKGKIKDAKTLLITKSGGLVLAVVSAFMMFYGK